MYNWTAVHSFQLSRAVHLILNFMSRRGHLSLEGHRQRLWFWKMKSSQADTEGRTSIFRLQELFVGLKLFHLGEANFMDQQGEKTYCAVGMLGDAVQKETKVLFDFTFYTLMHAQ